VQLSVVLPAWSTNPEFLSVAPRISEVSVSALLCVLSVSALALDLQTFVRRLLTISEFACGYAAVSPCQLAAAALEPPIGGEFKGDFPKALGDSQHVRIPPAAQTYQSDVETVHRLEEDEFFDLEDFASRGDFLAKVHTYQL
jgi:hypothetical protein